MSLLDSVPVYGSYRKSKEAEGICERARSSYHFYNDRLQETREASEKAVDLLLEEKIECSTVTLPIAVDLLGRVNKINYKEVDVVKETYIKFKKASEPEIRKNTDATRQILDAGVKGSSAGAAMALGSMGMVSSFGAASTGTAIASLSGVAAKNATLAWFGGGALSAGGAGMAGGAVVLGGIALAPVAVIGAYKYAAHAEKKMTDAVQYRNRVNTEIEKIEACIAVAESANKCISLFSDALSGLRDRLVSEMAKLDSLINDGCESQVVSFSSAKVILLVKSIKRLLEVKVVQEDGFSEEAGTAIAHVDCINEDRVAGFVSDLCSEKDVGLPEGVEYLGDIGPGEYSPQYFWFQGDIDESPKEKKEISLEGWPWLAMFGSLLVWGVWSGIAFYARWDFWPYFFLLIAVLSPVSVLAKEMPKEKKERVNGIVGFFIVAFVVAYLFW